MSLFDIFLDHESRLVKITALGEFFKKRRGENDYCCQKNGNGA